MPCHLSKCSITPSSYPDHPTLYWTSYRTLPYPAQVPNFSGLGIGLGPGLTASMPRRRTPAGLSPASHCHRPGSVAMARPGIADGGQPLNYDRRDRRKGPGSRVVRSPCEGPEGSLEVNKDKASIFVTGPAPGPPSETSLSNLVKAPGAVQSAFTWNFHWGGLQDG
eukprot:748237-Hanusia_phi.AAC.3